jgi:ComF family protein
MNRPPSPWMQELADATTALVVPSPCRVCHTTLLTAERLPICNDCRSRMRAIGPPLCWCCGRPFDSPRAMDSRRPLCRLCREGLYEFEHARSFGAYDDALVRALVLLKHRPVKPLGSWFAERLAEVISREPKLFPADVVVPVPLHPARQRERGHNQAELIARPLARLLGLPLGTYLLVRTRPRPARQKLKRRQRWETVRGAYEAREGARVDKLRVLLVDDVLTTGATLDACARALREAGALRVVAVTVARVVAGWASQSPAGEPAEAPSCVGTPQ